MTKKPNYKLRAVLFPLLGLFFALVCLALVVSAFGYTFKYENGKFSYERKGIILLATRPGDATVYLDGNKYRYNSPMFYLFPMRISRLKIGDHYLKVEKSGYEPWEGMVKVEPGLVAWVNYILLVPEKKEAGPYNLTGDITETFRSHDNTRVLVSTLRKEDKLYSMWDLSTDSKEIKKIFEKKLVEGETYKIVDFADSKNRIILEKKAGDVKTYLVITTTIDGDNWNLSTMYDLSFDEFKFNPKSDNEVFVTKGKNLYVLNYSDKTLSAVLATNVIELIPDEGSLYFVQNVEGNQGLWRMEQNNSKTNIVKNLPVSESYQIKYLPEVNSYVILPLKSKELYIYSVERGNPVLAQIAENVDWFSVSGKSRFVGFMQGRSFISYEIEKNLYFTTLKNREIANINWLSDEANIIYRENDKIYLVNFNGYYDKYLFTVSDKVPVFAAPGENNYYFGGINKDKNTLDLYAASL